MNGFFPHPKARLILVAVALFALTGSAGAALAQTPAGPVRPGEDTPGRHRALAEQYRAKAVDLRREAHGRQQELDDYVRQASLAPNKTGAERPWVKAKRADTEQLVRQAEEQARSLERFAEYHEFRARDLEGE